MNKVFLIGNLTRDPECATTNNGISYCKFGLAVPRPYTSGKDKEVDFFNITAWRTLAENCGKFLNKGSKAAIIGRIQIDNYEDRNGNKKSAAQIIADEVEFLNTKQDGKSNQKNEETKEKPASVHELNEVDYDDLPF